MYSMFYSRQTFWILQKKYAPLENHFISNFKLQILNDWTAHLAKGEWGFHRGTDISTLIIMHNYASH